MDFSNFRASTWDHCQRMAHNLIGILIASRLWPPQELNMPVSVDVVRALLVAVVSNPTLVSIRTATPTNECSFTRPGIIVILIHTPVRVIVGGVHCFGI